MHTVFEVAQQVGCSKHLEELTTDLCECKLPEILLSLHVIPDRLDDVGIRALWGPNITNFDSSVQSTC